MYKKSCGVLIKTARESKGLTVQDFSQKIGCSNSDVQLWENGEEIPETKYILKISKILDIEIEDILQSIGDSETIEDDTDQSACLDQANEEQRAGVKIVSVKKVPTTPRKSYYDTLHEEMIKQNIPISKHPEPTEMVKYSNGFFKKELVFGYIVCSIFLVLLIIFSTIKLVGVEVNNGNYTKYIEINIERSSGSQEVSVILTAKDDLVDLAIDVSLTFYKFAGASSSELQNSDREYIASYFGNLVRGESKIVTINYEPLFTYKGTYNVNIERGMVKKNV